MRPFPTDLLRPQTGTLSGPASDASVTIPLAPFEFDGDLTEEDGPVETEIRLDGLRLPSTDPADLAGRRFEFPLNPEDGYVDGSVYVEHAHHPVDVSVVEFGERRGDRLAATFEVVLAFEYEGLGDYADTPARLVTELRVAEE